MNVFTFTGNIGKDAEVRHTPSGHAVCSFSVAVKSGFGDKATTSWIRCSLWGKRAEGKLPGYLIKGAQVAISGEFSAREYEAQGSTRTSLEVNVKDLDLIGGRQSEDPQQASRPASQPTPAGEFADDIPF